MLSLSGFDTGTSGGYVRDGLPPSSGLDVSHEWNCQGTGWRRNLHPPVGRCAKRAGGKAMQTTECHVVAAWHMPVVLTHYSGLNRANFMLFWKSTILFLSCCWTHGYFCSMPEQRWWQGRKVVVKPQSGVCRNCYMLCNFTRQAMSFDAKRSGILSDSLNFTAAVTPIVVLWAFVPDSDYVYVDEW
jgi:hypothetical protein